MNKIFFLLYGLLPFCLGGCLLSASFDDGPSLTEGERAMFALRAKYPPPGQLVDVGGYNIHVSCQGEGSPTVVMEAGLGDWSYVWTYVVPAVSSFTSVCVYDRAGWGWSDRSPQARRADVIVDEFHRLLVNGRILPPYVLVGHSVGGPYIRLFAHKYPAEVAGMVLVDSAHEEQSLRYPPAYPAAPDKAAIEDWFEKEKIAASGYYALYLSDFTADYANPRLPRDVDTARIALYASRPWIWGTLAEEAGGLEESMAVVRNACITSLGNIPLVVLAAQKGFDHLSPDIRDDVKRIHGEMQQELAALSPQGRLIEAQASDHYIQYAQPDLVIQAIKDVVTNLRQP